MSKSLIWLVFVIFIAIYTQLASIQFPFTDRVQDWRTNGKYFAYRSSLQPATHLVFYIDSRTLVKHEKEQVLLLLHGFPTSSFDWIKIWPDLDKKFTRVIALDFLGFGFSDKPPNHNYSIHEQADIVISLLDTLQVSSVHVLCHDYAVSVVQELLARHLNQGKVFKMESICFLNGGLFVESYRPKLIQNLLRMDYIGSFISRLTVYPIFKRNFASIFGTNQPTEDEFQEHWSIMSFNNGNLIYHKLIKYIDDRSTHSNRWRDAVAVNAKNKIIPVCLINGPKDPVSGRHLADYYSNQITNENVTILNEDIGHYPQLEDSKNVIKHYFEFLSKI